MHCLGCTDLQKHSLASPTKGVGVAGSNIRIDLSSVDVVLHAKVHPRGPNGMATYSRRTNTHAHTHTPTFFK